MKEYLRERENRGRNASVTGIVLTLLVHAGVFCLISFTGLKYIYPPPEESSFVIDFQQEEEEEIVKPKYGREPQGEQVDKEKEVELVQRSQSPHQSTAQNLTPATKPDDFGDVETPEPEREKEPELDPRAAFPGMAKKDTSLTAPHGAAEASATFKAGQSNGNTETAKPDGAPNALVEGRKVNKATLKKPGYNLQESGRVVVKIWVDQYGKVKRAEPGADGTTVTNAKLWAAARAAAMDAVFDMKADAPALQEGTITYIFNLK